MKMKKILIMALLISIEVLAETPKLSLNAIAVSCEPIETSALEKLTQSDLESIYCGYVLGIESTDLAQLKEFEKYSNDINMKLSISKTNTDKNIKCARYKSEVEFMLSSAKPPYVIHCENHVGFPDLLK